jgi:PAS domain S-box-containing protein
MKLKLILSLLFIVVYSVFFYKYSITKNERVNQSLDNQIKNLELHYALTKDYFLNDVKSIQDNVTKNKKIISIISQAIDSNEEQRNILRNELYTILLPMYRRIQKRGILQFQFVFSNNVSFLRMHKPDKFGDDLSKVRYSFNNTNKTLKPTEGFEQGKTTHGFRYVFPLFNANNKHIGAVEISLASYALQEKLLKVDKIHSHFLVKKDLFNVKEWDTGTSSKRYITSIECKDYLFTITKETSKKRLKEEQKYIINNLKQEIDSHLLQAKPFAIYTPYKETIKIVTFLPIKNIKDKKVVAYIVSYTDNDNIYHIIKNYKILSILTFFGLILLFYFIYKNLHYKQVLLKKVDEKIVELNDLNENLEKIVSEKTKDLNEKNNELKSLLISYDKYVMYSSTDLDGIITDVSDAFCRVSGYTRKELIGQNHNIVRHPDTKAEVFQKLWEELPKQKPIESEVKNRKKDGGFYWVKSYFFPDYDKSNKHIGYSCIRENITNRKEVQSLQHEIEETQKEVIFKMGSIGESRSHETGLHVKRVSEYSKIFALKYGLSENDAELLKQASPMHDIGKVAIADDILNKPDKLTENEMNIMKKHAELGFDMLHGSTRPLLNTAAIVAHEHHEKWDGSGYPQGLTALEIHIYGRITAIADVFDALGNKRCYKEAWDDDKIFNYFKEQRGKHFEPKLVDIFFDNIDDFLAIRDSLSD